jgi:hypothetical protein
MLAQGRKMLKPRMLLNSGKDIGWNALGMNVTNEITTEGEDEAARSLL